MPNSSRTSEGIAALLLRRKFLSLQNRVLSMTLYEWGRNTAFLLMGFWMLAGLFYGFLRVLRYLSGVELIGGLLIWKLTAMSLLTTFSMVVLSSLIISLTTLFYSSDLRYLMRAPVPLRWVFWDKSLETVFFSSWMIALAIFPYFLALGRVYHYGWGFYAVFLLLMVPFLVLAAVLGMGFTLTLMYCFPSSRTRDVVWVLSSLSVGVLYMLLRFSEPERLIRPDALQLVSEYLQYLQAPTAPYAPSWWLSQALAGYAGGRMSLFWTQAALLTGAAAAAYGALLWLAGRMYARGYSGAQEGRRAYRSASVPPTMEYRLTRLLCRWGGDPDGGESGAAAALFWKDRKCFFRDVKHWSQILLVGALIGVYLFSIHRLPLDTPDLKSLVCFLNIGIAGFVLSSLGLRFTFPSISLEGRSFWVVRGAPLGIETLMLEKFVFSLAPMLVLSTVLVAVSNHLLGADRFISWLTLITIWLTTWTLAGMGVGFGAIFPRFHVENIHQIESSAGGFVYMACALAYVGATVAAEAWPVQMHFQERLGRLHAWDWRYAGLSVALLAVINLVAFVVPWVLGRRCLQRYEGD
ncbi:MAG TPA: hypothetical protein DD417_16565 [Elusimicrobia bacterium]|nr:hypothetical protein [Elusimicrobiota bacterium]